MLKEKVPDSLATLLMLDKVPNKLLNPIFCEKILNKTKPLREIAMIFFFWTSQISNTTKNKITNGKETDNILSPVSRKPKPIFWKIFKFEKLGNQVATSLPNLTPFPDDNFADKIPKIESKK